MLPQLQNRSESFQVLVILVPNPNWHNLSCGSCAAGWAALAWSQHESKNWMATWVLPAWNHWKYSNSWSNSWQWCHVSVTAGKYPANSQAFRQFQATICRKNSWLLFQLGSVGCSSTGSHSYPTIHPPFGRTPPSAAPNFPLEPWAQAYGAWQKNTGAPHMKTKKHYSM